MNKVLQVQNPHTGQYENVFVSGLPDPVQPQVVQVPSAKQNSHPLLIAGVVLGLFVGLIACLPPKIRGWVVLAILVGIVWLCWRANTDAAQQVGVTDAAPRAELVKMPEPEVRRAELVRLPPSLAHK